VLALIGAGNLRDRAQAIVLARECGLVGESTTR
jgi:hypothetical protein